MFFLVNELNFFVNLIFKIIKMKIKNISCSKCNQKNLERNSYSKGRIGIIIFFIPIIYALFNGYDIEVAFVSPDLWIFYIWGLILVFIHLFFPSKKVECKCNSCGTVQTVEKGK